MIKPTKLSQVERKWHLIDAKDKVLGRLATEIAIKLIGKNKPYFVHNLDCGDYIVVTNAKKIKVTGRKELQKRYYAYSGYPGGLTETTYLEMKEKHPDRIIIKAVSNMLPKNKLRACWISRLYVFPEDKHPHEEKFKVATESAQKKGKKE